jgi:Cu2+-exporting ATPase
LVKVGTAAWVKKQNISPDQDLLRQAEQQEKKGITCVFVLINDQMAGLLGFADGLREDATAVIKQLQQDQVGITVLSGDKKTVVETITASFGDIDRKAEVLPQDKSEVVKQLQQQGEVVAMVGDGINDSPALVQADVSLAMASGTDVSIESADIVLSHQSFKNVIKARRLASATLHTIKQNIMLSFLYNIIMIPLAMSSLVNPLVAALTMPLSSLLVIGNAARLKRFLKD